MYTPFIKELEKELRKRKKQEREREKVGQGGPTRVQARLDMRAPVRRIKGEGRGAALVLAAILYCKPCRRCCALALFIKEL